MCKSIPFTALALAGALLASAIVHAQSGPATQPAATQPAATQPVAPVMPAMETHTLVLLVLGDNPPQLEPAAAAQLQRDHLAHIGEMAKTGKLVVAGPFSARDDEKLRGMLIFNCPIDEARAMASEDPAVKAGRMKIVCMNWHTGKGVIEFHPPAGTR